MNYSWLAGYLLGDGSIYQQSHHRAYGEYRYIAIEVDSKDKELVEALVPFGFAINFRSERGKNGIWRARMQGKKTLTLLKELDQYWHGEEWNSWAAGFFDAEGCIYYNKNRWRIVITQNDRSILELFQTKYGGKIYEHKNGFNGEGISYDYAVSSRKERLLASDISPYVRCGRKSGRIRQSLDTTALNQVRLKGWEKRVVRQP